MNKFLFILLLVPLSCSNTSKYTQTTPIQDSLNIENLKYVVWSLPFKHKDIVIAQAVLETGWFKSDVCTNNNNLFGMKRIYTRTTTSDTVLNGYSHYPSWKHSVIDYYLLQSTRESIVPTNREQYFHYLDKVYSEVGVGYSSQLKDIIKRLGLDNDDPIYVKQKKVHKKFVKKKK